MRGRQPVEWVRCLEEARAVVSETRFRLLLIDLGLPDGNGLDFLKEVRKAGIVTPALVITARGDLSDRIAGLDEGADDYLVKPFALVELLSRCRALLRRPNELAREPVRLGNIELQPDTLELLMEGRPLAISRREAQLLIALLRRRGRVCTRAYLEDSLYEPSASVSPNALETSISRLRTLLARVGAEVDLRTVRGVGYFLKGCEHA